ncbi:hypothetical protein [Vibrio genomosp. F10]|uniref:hypothetical protein n=1 Tax=Vibrio genomosp. F10 TaxID=723171 RepID=UPI0003098B3D|nr:hypothetical protein [Vibrio genomosp. F10]OEF04972.1 hypothetical protein A1QI_09540 [Vibrio genomosp. F10 str. 9ZB36]
MKLITPISCALLVVSASASTFAEEPLQDMSDPMAIYTQAGFGVTDKGINIKVGQSYDTGNAETMAMNIIELKGMGGESLGWASESERNNSIDTARFRNFQVNTTNGQGAQLDLNYSTHKETLNASYSFIQALPELGGLNLYPLAGAGVRVQNGRLNGYQDEQINIDDSGVGYTVPGVYAIIGTYAKYSITDKLFVNYNPMWLTSLSGSDYFVDNAYGEGESSVFANELAVSYQFTPRFNIRYFANWTSKQDYLDADQRLEVNYQF